MENRPRIFYEIFVRSFADSNGDGIGDLVGIIQKLDYLQELGIEAIWLTPIFQSPSYHKYDCSNYFRIDPEYGDEQDLRTLIYEAAKRNIRIVLDLVLNHTSVNHPWFKEAAKNPESEYREYYFWLTPDEIAHRGIGQRRATDDSGVKNPWHWFPDEKKEKYYGMFSKDMPDLNYNSESLRNDVVEIAKYWLRLGVYGFRLDAAKHLFPFWERVSETHKFWQFFRSELVKDFPDVYLVGEVWDSPEVVAPFFNSFDACFNIDLSYDLKDVLSGQKNYKRILPKLSNTRSLYKQANPNYTDAILLSNHDQNRIASVLKGKIEKLKLAAGLLFTLPGVPYIYYGEEIGMKGRKPDPYIREPFPWNDAGETRWLRKKYNETLDFRKETSHVGTLFYHYKSMIQLRKSYLLLQHPEDFSFTEDDERLLCFTSRSSNEALLVVHNITSKIVVFRPSEEFGSIIYADRLIKMQQTAFEIPPFGTIIFSNKVFKA
jgi:alpha-amylase